MKIFKRANNEELNYISGITDLSKLKSDDFIKEEPRKYDEEKLDEKVFHIWESERVRELAQLGAIPNRIYVLENGDFVPNPATAKKRETNFNKLPGFKYLGLGKLYAFQNDQGKLVKVEDDI